MKAFLGFQGFQELFSTKFVARFVPFLAYVMSLIRSFLTISVSVISPAACHLRIFQVLPGRSLMPCKLSQWLLGS